MQPDTKRHVSQSRRGGSQHREEEHKRGLDPKHVRDCSLSSQCACFRLHTIHSTRVPSPTSKTAPNPSVFNAFYFQMCFAPQRRALFNISTSKRCFVPFHFEIGFAPQRRAPFHLSSPQMSPHRFSEPTFQPSGATKPLKKHSVSRLSYLFAHLHLLSSDLFSSDSSPC